MPSPHLIDASTQARLCAVKMEIHAACGTTTSAKADEIKKHIDAAVSSAIESYQAGLSIFPHNIWKHKKAGGLYRIIMRGFIEASGVDAYVYRCEKTGETWIRPASEFQDGRFELVS